MNIDTYTYTHIRESTVLANLLKAYDTVEVKAKLEELEAIVGSNA